MKATPLFPQVAEAETRELPPFEPWAAMPIRAVSDRSIDGDPRTVLLAIVCDLAGRKSIECLMSNQAISDLTGIHIDSIRKSLSKLQAAGYITRFKDREVAGVGRRIEILFRTWDSDSKTRVKRTAPTGAYSRSIPI